MHPRLSRSVLALAQLALAADAAHAQSPIYGVDHLNDVVYRTDTADFTGSFTVLAPVSRIRALDFDADAIQLWGIDDDTNEFGTIDLSSGVFFPLGTVPVTPGVDVTGLAAHPDGATWYMTQHLVVTDYTLLLEWSPSLAPPVAVGVIATGRIIDISVDSQGNLYGLSITNDALYSIDTSTGVGTVIGPVGYPLDLAQGMDFDWRDDTLYATLSAGIGGAAVFATIDVMTGAGTPIVSTTSIAGNMEMAVQSPPLEPVAYCFGDGAGALCPCNNPGALDAGCANSATGDGAGLDARGTYSAVELRLVGGVPNQSVLFFEGTAEVNGGDGAVFGDGLRCAGSNLVRLNTQAMDASGLCLLAGTVQQFGGGGAPGETRTYQGWYRDPVAGPCGTGFNLTNGIRVDY